MTLLSLSDCGDGRTEGRGGKHGGNPEEGSRDRSVTLAGSLSAHWGLHQPYCNILSKTEKSTVQMAQVDNLEGGRWGRVGDAKMKATVTARDPARAPQHLSLSLWQMLLRLALGQRQIS